MLYEVKKMEVV